MMKCLIDKVNKNNYYVLLLTQLHFRKVSTNLGDYETETPHRVRMG